MAHRVALILAVLAPAFTAAACGSARPPAPAGEPAAAMQESGGEQERASREESGVGEEPGRRSADPGSREPRRFALLIGIADYDDFDARGAPGQTDLRGPHNDVRLMRRMLERRQGFDSTDVHVLLDRDASREGIRSGFRWIADRATDPGDVVVVYFSGHGSWAPDRDGDEAALIPGDTVDEGLVPWDARRGRINDPDQLILDDEIREWLAGLGTENVTLVLDACYSGTLTRSASDVAQKGSNPPPLAPAAVGAGALEGLADLGHTLITAAASNQTALEARMANTYIHGVLTYHLVREIEAAGPQARYDEVMSRVRRAVASTGADQVPQLEGRADARLFRVQGSVPHKAFALVEPAVSDVWTIDAGAMHGVRVDAEYEVFAPGEMEFRGAPLARVRVDSLEESRSLVRHVEGPASIPAGARAVPARTPMGARTLKSLNVWVDPGAERAREAVAALDFVTVTQEEDAHAWVIDSAGVIQVHVQGLEVPPLQKYSPAWVAATEVETVTVKGYTPTAPALCRPLARAFAIEALSRIENPTPPALDVAVRVLPTRVGRPRDAEAGVDTLYADTLVEHTVWLRVTASSAAELPPLHVTAAIEGQISGSAAFFPGREIPADDLKNWFPLLRTSKLEPPFGPEFIKVVVSTTPYSLTPLMKAVPDCAGVTSTRDPSRSRGNDPDDPLALLNDDAQPIDGWKSLRHPVVILPGRGGQ